MAALRPRGSRWPTISTVPPSGSTTPRHISRVVVLPAPLGPSRATRSPRRTVRSTPSTARPRRYVFSRPRARRTSLMPASVPAVPDTTPPDIPACAGPTAGGGSRHAGGVRGTPGGCPDESGTAAGQPPLRGLRAGHADGHRGAGGRARGPAGPVLGQGRDRAAAAGGGGSPPPGRPRGWWPPGPPRRGP